MEGYYPPVGQVVEFCWSGDWIEATFLKMELDSDGDELCSVKDCDSGDIHHVLFREKNEGDEWEDCNDWTPLFNCEACEEHTRGHLVCDQCDLRRDGTVGYSSDEDYN